MNKTAIETPEMYRENFETASKEIPEKGFKPIPRMMPITKAVTESGLSYKFLKSLCDAKQIPFFKSGNRILINYDRLIDYLNNGGAC